jgi:hypothetical protein
MLEWEEGVGGKREIFKVLIVAIWENGLLKF